VKNWRKIKMEIKIITLKEFKDNKKSVNGYTPIPETERKKELVRDEFSKEIEKICKKRDKTIDKNVQKEYLIQGIKPEDDYIKNAREILKRHSENRKELLKYDSNESGRFDEVIQRKISDEKSKKNSNIKEFGTLIKDIMMQMHQGVLVGGKVTIRKDGVFPYRCHYRMSDEEFINILLSNKADVLSSMKSKEKIKMMDGIYNAFENLEISKSEDGYYRNRRIDISKEEVIKFDTPFLISDEFSGRGDKGVGLLYISGIRIEFNGDITWIGVDFSNMEACYEENNISDETDIFEEKAIEQVLALIRENKTDIEHDLSFESSTKQYLNKRFEKVLKYTLNSFLEKERTVNELFSVSIQHIKKQGSKWLIIKELTENIEEDGKH